MGDVIGCAVLSSFRLWRCGACYDRVVLCIIHPFWESADELIYSLLGIDTGRSNACLDGMINTFSGLFDPDGELEEYVLAKLVERMGRILPAHSGEQS